MSCFAAQDEKIILPRRERHWSLWVTAGCRFKVVGALGLEFRISGRRFQALGAFCIDTVDDKILHHLICRYLYCTTRIPVVLVF